MEFSEIAGFIDRFLSWIETDSRIKYEVSASMKVPIWNFPFQWPLLAYVCSTVRRLSPFSQTGAASEADKVALAFQVAAQPVLLELTTRAGTPDVLLTVAEYFVQQARLYVISEAFDFQSRTSSRSDVKHAIESANPRIPVHGHLYGTP
eukprot:GHVU01182485.1.p1 GENE.GHVU01182485.1~~GHVU01182485.1.p1  ORF type:complete len:149 (-),score=7.57 GHVU01182485.1:161-607(-)